MKWSADVLAYIHAHPYLTLWPDAEVVLERFETPLSKSLPTALPIWMSYAAGGDAEQALPLGAAFTLLHVASSVLDDFQDQDTDHPWTSWGLDRVLGSTLAMVFLSQSCLARLDAQADTKCEILDSFAEGWVIAAVGQSESLGAEASVSNYWRHALAKSSVGFAVAAWSGARLATDDAVLCQAAREYGMSLGTLLQIADDFQDFVNAPLAPSASALSSSLPVVMAQDRKDHPAHSHLQALMLADQSTRDSAWAKDVCAIVREMGGLSRTVGIAKAYETKAVAALAVFNPDRCAALAAYAESILTTDAD